MTKKQKNLIFGIAVLVISLIALLFSDDSNKLISFGDEEVIPEEDTYDKEVIIAPTIAIDDSSNEIIISISPESESEQELESETDVSTNTYQVVKVVDGDTVDVNINGNVERLRLIGIDTPETVDPRREVQCFGIEASNKAKELLMGKSVSLEEDASQGDRDKYKRLLRYVFLPDGTNFNLYMIKEGFAHEYTYDEVYKYQLDFKQAEVEARNANKGLWSSEACSGNE
jgi:micrococcal nuclease